jgi:hypothetical protein
MRSEQLVERDRKVANAFAASVVDGIRDRRPDTGDADLADAVRAHGRVRVGDIGPDHVALGHVHVHGYVVLSEAWIHYAAIALVELRLLLERRFRDTRPAAHVGNRCPGLRLPQNIRNLLLRCYLSCSGSSPRTVR